MVYYVHFWWPPSSPDLNPIENYWSFMVNNMDNRTATSKEEIWNWVAYFEYLIDSMPDRLARVIEINGEVTSY